LVGHADREGDAGEVAIAGLLLPVFGAKGNAAGLGPEVLVGVPQGVDGVDQRPRQHDGQNGGADQQRPRCTAMLLREEQRVTRPGEAGDAGPNQQRPGAAFGLVFPGGELRRA